MLSKNIKVLYPILHYPPVIGGLEQWAQNIAERQPPNVEVLIVTGRVKGEENFEKKGNLTIFRTSLFSLQNLSSSSLVYIITAVPCIFFRSVFLSKNVMIFHCHGFISAALGCLLSTIRHRPFIGTEQSTGWARGFSKFFRRFVYKKAKLCIAASNAVREEFEKLGVKNSVVIPNGVDLDKFTSADVGRRTSHVILSVGRLVEVKGHTYLIDALAKIRKEIPDAQLVFVGDGSRRKSLEMQAEALGAKKSVRFAGEVPHDSLPQYYAGADVFVMPSLSEGFGIAVIEAMASGIPVVASCVGGLKDIIDDGKTGLLVQAANSGEIAAAVCRLWKDRALKERMINEARMRVQKYDWSNISSHVRSIYRKLVD